ncbi:MAG: hypothetical protein FWG50_13950 [Kiritimatiellaeota bacterium]|nr:hypothetical protein [Kiritimatiellota bacterium]
MMKTRMKLVCLSAVALVAMTGCRTKMPADPLDGLCDYIDELEVESATVGDYTYAYTVTNGGR